MKEGSPEWMRAKYAAMMVAHLSIFENDAQQQKSFAADQAERKPSANQPEKGGDHVS